jgi:hydroxyethylthiazole kinase
MSIIQIFISPVAANIAVNACIATGYHCATVTDMLETQEFASKTDGLLINLGNLVQTALPSMICAAEIFQSKRKPWVLDPVAVGATKPRLEAALKLLEYRPAIIRGNASEIKTLSYALDLTAEPGNGQGPDSLDSVSSARNAADALATYAQCIVGVSGEIDYITNGHTSQTVDGGHDLMPKVIGLGCALSTIIAGFVTDMPPYDATIRGFQIVAKAGEMAGRDAKGAGTFQPLWLDALERITNETNS